MNAAKIFALREFYEGFLNCLLYFSAMKIFASLLGLALFSSCSTDSEYGELLHYKEIASCSAADSFSDEDFGKTADTVYLALQKNGTAEATMKLGLSCGGVKYSLAGDRIDDTLFVDARTKSDAVTSCSCERTLLVTIPEAFTDAKILIYDHRRNFPRTIVQLPAE